MHKSLVEFNELLRTRGAHAALGFLNARTTHRFTGIYRFDGEWLRNLALFDRWNLQVTRGEDAPMRQTFCALVSGQGTSLEVLDGSVDPRFPWMNDNAVVSYCGALIAIDGVPAGTLCHFDVKRCESASSELPLLAAAGPALYRVLAG